MIVEVWEKYLHSHYHGNLVSECVSGEDFFSLGFEYLLLILSLMSFKSLELELGWLFSMLSFFLFEEFLHGV